MKKIIIVCMVGIFFTLPTLVKAQDSTKTKIERKKEMKAKWKNATPEQKEKAKEMAQKRKEKIENMTPEEKEAVKEKRKAAKAKYDSLPAEKKASIKERIKAKRAAKQQ
jgi:hypothetical protein